MREYINNIDELEIGRCYMQCNPYHPEYEYGNVWYAGVIYNKYDEKCYLFSERPLPDGYDGEPDRWNIGGPFFTQQDIIDGCIRK